MYTPPGLPKPSGAWVAIITIVSTTTPRFRGRTVRDQPILRTPFSIHTGPARACLYLDSF